MNKLANKLNLKLTDITSLYKSELQNKKSNYSVSVQGSHGFLEVLYYIILYYIMLYYIIFIFSKIFSKYQTCFWKGLGFQHSLIAMADSFKNSLENGSEYPALLIDLSKSFNRCTHNLILAKLYVYDGFDVLHLRLTRSYLQSFQRVINAIVYGE